MLQDAQTPYTQTPPEEKETPVESPAPTVHDESGTETTPLQARVSRTLNEGSALWR